MHKAVLSDFSCGSLLLSADDCHLVIGYVSIFATSRRTSSVRASHPAKPQVLLQIASLDSIEGHKFDVILVSADGHVSASAVRLSLTHSVGDEQIWFDPVLRNPALFNR